MLNCFFRTGIAKKHIPKAVSTSANIFRPFSHGLGFDPNKDYYSVLGLTSSAQKKDIKSAFAKMAKLHHPDKNNGTFELRLITLGDDKKFKEITEAYEVLNSKTKKADYDSMRNSGGGFGGGGYSSNSQQ